MLSALIAFVGSTTFRMLWGEISAWLTAARDHRREIERMQEQGKLDAAAHARELATIELQHRLGVEVVRVQSEAGVTIEEAGAWRTISESTSKPIGVWWVDLWNGVIRPGVATWAIVMITGNYCGWWTLDEAGWNLAGASLGLYLASRDLFKRGK